MWTSIFIYRASLFKMHQIWSNLMKFDHNECMCWHLMASQSKRIKTQHPCSLRELKCWVSVFISQYGWSKSIELQSCYSSDSFVNWYQPIPLMIMNRNKSYLSKNGLQASLKAASFIHSLMAANSGQGALFQGFQMLTSTGWYLWHFHQ